MARPIPPLARISLVLAVVLVADARIDTSVLMERATAFRHQGDHAAAIVDLRHVLHDDPRHDAARAMLVDAYVDRAVAFRATDNLDQAIDELEDAVHFDRENHAVRALLVEHYLELASHLEAERDRIAVLKTAVRVVPENAEARLQLGQAYIDVGVLTDGEKELARARENGIAPELVLEPLGNVMLRQHKYEDVLAAFSLDDPVLAALRPMVLVFHGRALAGLGRFEESAAAFRQALAGAPDNALAMVGLGRLALDAGDLTTAARELERAVAAAPDAAAVLMLRGDLRHRLGDYAGAVAAYGAAMESERDPLTRMAQVLSRIGAGEAADVLPAIERILAQAPRHTGAHYLRALAAFATGDQAAALNYIEAVRTTQPNHLPSRLIHGASAFAVGDYPLAETHLNDFLAALPAHVEARRLLGLTMLRLERPDEALAVLDPLTTVAGDDPELLALVGDAAVAAGALESGHDHFVALAALAPQRADVLARVGTAKAALGDLAGGVRALEAALTREPSLARAQQALAMTQLRAGDHDGALYAARRLAQLAPQNPAGHVLAGLAHFAAGTPGRARLALLQALEIRDDDHDALVVLAEVLAAEGDLEAARSHLGTVVARTPEDLRAWLRLADLAFQAGDPAAAETLLIDAVRVHPSALAPRVLLGRLYLATDQAERAVEVAEGHLRSEGESLALRDVLGRALLVLDRTSEAVVVLEPLVSALPDAAPVHYTMAIAYAVAGDEDRQRGSLERVLALVPGHVEATVDLTRLALRRGDMQAADTLIAALRAAAPATALEFDGRVALRDGRHGEAVDLLTRAAATATSTDLTLALAAAHSGTGRADAAVRTLESWLARFPADTTVRFAMATQLIDQARFADALVHLRLVEQRDPLSVAVLNNIAWVNLAMGDAAAATPYVERAPLLAGGDADVTDTAVKVFEAAGEADRAAALLAPAAPAVKPVYTSRYPVPRGGGDRY